MQRLIVTADDCGLSEGINQATYDLHKRGYISAASVMTNFPGYRRALERLDAEARSGKIEGGDTSLPAGIRAVRERLSSGWMPVRGASPEVLARLAQFLVGWICREHADVLRQPRIVRAIAAVAVRQGRVPDDEIAGVRLDLDWRTNLRGKSLV